jgi:amino acid transporter
MNIYLKSVKWVGKILALILLAYLFVGLFFVENISQLAVGCFIAIFITTPTVFIFFFKDRFFKKYPKFIKRWKIIRIIYIVITVVFVLLLAAGQYVTSQKDKTAQTIDFINSKRITLDDVMGKNLPPQPDQKLNDSTIAGIDANSNSIRDDVELAIFKKYPNSAKIRAAELQYAQALQLELTQVYDSKTLVAVMKKKDSAYFCIGASQKLSLNDLNKAEGEIVNISLNTEERKKIHEVIFDRYMTGYSSPVGNNCDIDITN